MPFDACLTGVYTDSIEGSLGFRGLSFDACLSAVLQGFQGRVDWVM